MANLEENLISGIIKDIERQEGEIKNLKERIFELKPFLEIGIIIPTRNGENISIYKLTSDLDIGLQQIEKIKKDLKTGNFDKRDILDLKNYIRLILDVCFHFANNGENNKVIAIPLRGESEPQQKKETIPITSQKYDYIQSYIRILVDPQWDKRFKEVKIRGDTYIQRLEIMRNRLGEIKNYIQKNNFNETVSKSIKNIDPVLKGYLANIYNLLDKYVETNEVLYKFIVSTDELGDKYVLRIRSNISQMQQEIRNLKISTSHLDLSRFLELIKQKNVSDDIIIKSLEGFQARLEEAKTYFNNTIRFGNIALRDVRLELIADLESHKEKQKLAA